MSINFCHISPTKYIPDFTSKNGSHLILAHLVEQDKTYRDFYANLNDGKEKILDNSAFEMYKQGREMYPPSKLIEMGNYVKADIIVMSDYPNEHSSVTIDAAKKLIPEFKQNGFGTFFVPQSQIGNYDDYMSCVEWALSQNDIDRIGLSILGCPNAFGVESHNNLQRFMSRWSVLKDLKNRGMLKESNKNIFHCLGMVDGPNEIELLKDYHEWIATWDSSAAVWAGLNEIKFDNSPTGLIHGKFELEVEFDTKSELTYKMRNDVNHNIDFINKQCK